MGDPQFPNAILKRPRTDRILQLQKIFETYSDLKFTITSDRSVAISGLESRLARAFGSQSNFGVLEDYLHQSLLWHRAGEKPLRQVRYPPQRAVPSWSWMAYAGKIRYFDVPSEGMTWSRTLSFLPAREYKDHENEYKQTPVREFKAIVNGLAIDELRKEPWRIIIDNPDAVELNDLSCILIAKHKDTENSAIQYLIIVVTAKFQGGYQRVGVGRIQERHLLKDQPSLEGRVM
jgi:hypothetical protein